MPRIAGDMHNGHAAAAELALEDVATRKRLLKVLDRVVDQAVPCGGSGR